MKYMLDTNVCIRLLKADSPKLLQRFGTVMVDEIGISTVVRFELYYGAFKSQKMKENLEKLDYFFKYFQTVPFDEKTADYAGKIRAKLERNGNVIGPYDLLIGATAYINGCILVTNNTREFARIDNLNIEDWES